MKEAFQAISNWEVDPRDEDMKRLFFRKAGIEGVLAGKQNIIIGRKGSGKTSIAEYIYQTYKTRTKIFNLSDVNFFEINGFLTENTGTGSGPNLFWRYVIYYLVIEMMAKSKLLDYKVVKSIKSVINVSSDSDFMRRVSYLRNLDFKLSAFGVEASVSSDRSFAQLNLLEKCTLFETVINQYAGNDPINLIFDELDSQFNVSDTESFVEYEVAVKSLVVTALDVKRRLPKLNPVVLIRDDIFDIITRRFSESNKLIDKTFNLKWAQHELIEMCEHRIMSDTALEAIQFDELFQGGPVISKIMRSRRKNLVSMCDFFFEHTMQRPRDVILFLREIARACLENGSAQINSNAIRVALPRYSFRLRQELTDEIFSSLPNISQVFDALTETKATKFRSDELMEFMMDEFDTDEEEARRILNMLFYFSVIGIAEGTLMRFRYLDERAKYIPDLNIEIHPGIRDAIRFFSQ